MKKILITGITGFAGSFLAEHLIAKGESDITGTYIDDESLRNVSSFQDKVKTIKIDLQNADAVSQLFQKTQPDVIFHLAAFASPRRSFENPRETIVNNVTVQINVLEALRQHQLFTTKMLIISSGDIYGIVTKDDLPIDEDTPIRPTSPYSVSKVTQDFLGLQYFLTYKLPLVRVRPFNHIGPRQAPYFVIPEFAKRLVEIERGKSKPVLKVGNLDAKRDFTDVRDMVRAYDMILEKGKSGEVYNIGSGASHSVKEVLDILLSFTKVKVSVEQDPALVRPVDNPDLICDCRKMQKITGWKPEIPLEQSLKEIFEYWRTVIT